MTRSRTWAFTALALTAAILLGCTGGNTAPGKKPAKTAAQSGRAQASKAQVEAAVARVFPALIRIYVVTRQHGGGREQNEPHGPRAAPARGPSSGT